MSLADEGEENKVGCTGSAASSGPSINSCEFSPHRRQIDVITCCSGLEVVRSFLLVSDEVGDDEQERGSEEEAQIVVPVDALSDFLSS
jgi:hypothetical protein